MIRPATPGDARELFEIRRAAILALATPAMREDMVIAWADAHPPAWTHVLIRERDVRVFEHEGTMAGWLSATGCRIDGLYVSPPHAGRGIGTALLASAEAEMAARGCREILLDASVNALHFYQRRGYKPVGARHPDDEPTFGAQPMRKPVSAVDAVTDLLQ